MQTKPSIRVPKNNNTNKTIETCAIKTMRTKPSIRVQENKNTIKACAENNNTKKKL